MTTGRPSARPARADDAGHGHVHAAALRRLLADRGLLEDALEVRQRCTTRRWALNGEDTALYSGKQPGQRGDQPVLAGGNAYPNRPHQHIAARPTSQAGPARRRPRTRRWPGAMCSSAPRRPSLDAARHGSRAGVGRSLARWRAATRATSARATARAEQGALPAHAVGRMGPFAIRVLLASGGAETLSVVERNHRKLAEPSQSKPARNSGNERGTMRQRSSVAATQGCALWPRSTARVSRTLVARASV